jgi:hypothetical protein
MKEKCRHKKEISKIKNALLSGKKILDDSTSDLFRMSNANTHPHRGYG